MDTETGPIDDLSNRNFDRSNSANRFPSSKNGGKFPELIEYSNSRNVDYQRDNSKFNERSNNSSSNRLQQPIKTNDEWNTPSAIDLPGQSNEAWGGKSNYDSSSSFYNSRSNPNKINGPPAFFNENPISISNNVLVSHDAPHYYQIEVDANLRNFVVPIASENLIVPPGLNTYLNPTAPEFQPTPISQSISSKYVDSYSRIGYNEIGDSSFKNSSMLDLSNQLQRTGVNSGAPMDSFSMYHNFYSNSPHALNLISDSIQPTINLDINGSARDMGDRSAWYSDFSKNSRQPIVQISMPIDPIPTQIYFPAGYTANTKNASSGMSLDVKGKVDT
jgi:hypothetical protein